MGLPTTFHQFGGLPDDIRERIWALAAGERLNPRGRLIELSFEINTRVTRKYLVDQTNPADDGVYIQYGFRLWGSRATPEIRTIWQSSTDAYRIYLRRNPDFVQYRWRIGNNRRLRPFGQQIRFNGSRDRIFLPPHSLFLLGLYGKERKPYYGPFSVQDGGLGPDEDIRAQDLIGFNRIQVLETNLPNNILALDQYESLLQEIFTYRRFVTNPDDNSIRPVYIRISAGTTVTTLVDLSYWIDAMTETNYQTLAHVRDWFRCSTDPNDQWYWVNCPIAANGSTYVDGIRNEVLPFLAEANFIENVEEFFTVLDDPVPDEYGTPPTRDQIWGLFRHPPPTPEESIDRALEKFAIVRRNNLE